MIEDDVRGTVLRPGLVWGFDFVDGLSKPVFDTDLVSADVLPPAGFRWLHFNLADQRSVRWLNAAGAVPASMRELLLGPEEHQRFVIDKHHLGLALHDIEYEFNESDANIGVLRLVLCPRLVITGRHHPLRSAEALKKRLDSGICVTDAPGALELVFGSMVDVFRGAIKDLDIAVEAIEDELLQDRATPDAKTFINMRSLMVRLHRVFGGMRSVFNRLEEEEGDPATAYQETIDRFTARLANLDSELLAVQSQLRLLRDEIDLQATQQTNENLYFLSVLTALLMPATLVTGIFGMNTSGLLWTAGKYGSLWATGLALGSALVVYIILRFTGFIRR
jgi:Mg2+ and Co2+ transporter CorA